MKQIRPGLRLEPLETRTVPAKLLDAKTVIFKDIDDDIVTVSLSKPVLTTDAKAVAVFAFDVGTVAKSGGVTDHQVLQTLNLAALGAAAKGLSVTVSVVKPDGKTKSTADIGFIDATEIPLGSVTVTGDLGKIVAGKNAYTDDPYNPVPIPAVALKLLSVGSLGAKGAATQAAGGDLASVITGHLSKLAVAGDIVDAQLSVAGNLPLVTVGGSVKATAPAGDFAGSIAANGAVGAVTIRGDLEGGDGTSSGSVSGRSVGAVTIGGDLRGGAGPASGSVIAEGYLAPVIKRVRLVTRDPYGYGPPDVEIIEKTVNYRLVGGGIKSVTVGGDVIGGGGGQSGAVASNLGSVGAVKITGDLTGGTATEAGGVFAKSGAGNLDNGVPDDDTQGTVILGGHVGAVTVGGSLTGGSQARAGSIIADGGSIKSVKIGENLVGGAGEQSGAVVAKGLSQAVVGRRTIRDPELGNTTYSVIVGYRLVGGAVGRTTVGGSVTGGGGAQSGAVGSTLGTVGPVSVTGRIVNRQLAGGSVTGGAGEESGAVFAKGKVETLGGEDPDTPAVKVFLGGKVGAVTVAGSLTGKGGKASGSVTADLGSVTSVKIGGDLVGGEGENSGAVQAAGDTKAKTRRVTVRDYGYVMTYTQTVGYTLVGGAVGPVTVGGSVLGGNGKRSGSVGSTLGTVASVNVTGDVTGGIGEESGAVSARAKAETVDVGIGNVAVGGTVGQVTVGGAVAGGAGLNSASVLADVSVSSVAVGKTWTAANIAVGVITGADHLFDTADDVITLPFLTAAKNRVGSVTIGGAVAGTAAPATDGFRFIARSFGSVKVNKAALKLTAGLDTLLLGATEDFKLVEFSPAAGLT